MSNGKGKQSYKGKPNGKSRGRKSDSYDAGESSRKRRDLKGSAVDLPNWVVEALVRVTPRDRVGPALEELGDASTAMAEARYHDAARHAKNAKSLSPQDATVRETLGLAAYRIGDWDTALAELRAYRRMAGDDQHLPVEMDVHRALGRDRDVEKIWELLNEADVHPKVWKEGKVVYGSYLLDHGKAAEAWDVTGPKRVGPDAHEADLRVWYVAARAAAMSGETASARRIADAILLNDPSFAGLDALDQEIAASQ